MEKIRPVAYQYELATRMNMEDGSCCGWAIRRSTEKPSNHPPVVMRGLQALYTREALEAVANAVLEEVSRIAMIDGKVDIAAIINEMTEE